MTTENTEGWFDPKATTFGDRVTGAREKSGMTQDQLAHRLGVKLKTLKDWEGDLSEPRANRLSMMAGLLNVSLRWLITGEGDGPGGPVDTPRLPRSAASLLAEIQDVRSQLAQSSDRLARLELTLRDMLQDHDAHQEDAIA